MKERSDRLDELCRSHGVAALYVFGSRAAEVAGWRRGGPLAAGSSDVDLAVLPDPAHRWDVHSKARFAVAAEDLLGVARVDLSLLPDLDPFVAAEAVRGERLWEADGLAADEYELYVLRRAGDLIPLERERIALALGSRR